MSRIYLSSDIHFVAKDIFEDIQHYKKSFKTIFITTGAETHKDHSWVDANRNGMKEAGFDLFDYTLTGKTPKDIESDLKDVDIVHVNGGNCHKIVTEAKNSGFESWIKQALERGVIYTGSSGGSISAAPDISRIYRDDTEGPMGLDLVPMLIIPHWGLPERHNLYLDDRLSKIFADNHFLVPLRDNQYLKIEDGLVSFRSV
ncbi:Type 1 glutamine amidotransferase-like domain-containing protein [Candidatus Dojkabacteria bacterium]|uniref:Type 1 glutamine amidotransferase-like domain-containing protein n=1 Tax=Candidatus Dojkabacteria bacterium TaxID=2099670 RepID=A0A955RK28_9BACT|nr:Type 1 glutamine amidotransferase-like domain-containing protein [Candidatus Dojkabacteria bacterium]